jgi:DinB superfamily
MPNEEDAMDRDVRDAPIPTAFDMQQAYRWVWTLDANLSEEQLRWQPNLTTPAIRFHLFHVACRANRLHQLMTGAERQLWHAEGVAARWGLDPTMLGFGESGAKVEDEAAMALPLPERDELLAYCERVLAAADEVLAAFGDEAMHRTATGTDGATFPLGEEIAGQLSHTARHLGMIECLRGVQGLRGTATI